MPGRTGENSTGGSGARRAVSGAATAAGVAFAEAPAASGPAGRAAAPGVVPAAGGGFGTGGPFGIGEVAGAASEFDGGSGVPGVGPGRAPPVASAPPGLPLPGPWALAVVGAEHETAPFELALPPGGDAFTPARFAAEGFGGATGVPGGCGTSRPSCAPLPPGAVARESRAPVLSAPRFVPENPNIERAIAARVAESGWPPVRTLPRPVPAPIAGVAAGGLESGLKRSPDNPAVSEATGSGGSLMRSAGTVLPAASR